MKANKLYKVLLVVFLCMLSGCINQSSKQLPALIYETSAEYAFSFLNAMNAQDTKTLDALLDKEAIVAYEHNPESIPLGYTSDQDSYISHMLALHSRYEEINEDKNNLASTTLSFIYSNKYLEDIWGVQLSEYSKYEFVVEDNRITLIYIYENAEEEQIAKEYMLGGVGIEYMMAEDGSHLLISNVYAGTPASVLNLQAGDRILSLNHVSISEMDASINEAEYRMLGAINTLLVMEVQRENSEIIEELTLTRMAMSDYLPLSDEEILNQIEE